MEADDQGKVYWKTDPHKFLDSPAFENVVAQYSGVIQQSDYDPQKVGKGAMSYTAVENSMKASGYLGKASARKDVIYARRTCALIIKLAM